MNEWKGGREGERKIKCLFWLTILEIPAEEAPGTVTSLPGLFLGSTLHQKHKVGKTAHLVAKNQNSAARRTLGLNPPWPKDMPILGSFLKPCIPTQYHNGDTRPWAHRQSPNCFNGILCSITLAKMSDNLWSVLTLLRLLLCFYFPEVCELLTPFVISRSRVHFPNSPFPSNHIFTRIGVNGPAGFFPVWIYCWALGVLTLCGTKEVPWALSLAPHTDTDAPQKNKS